MRSRRSQSGFTLMELMITVVIVGVLATIAIPTFTSYIYRSRTTEATTMLAEIRQRQESYRAEFNQYCDVSGALTTWTPAASPGSLKVPWPGGPGWAALGAAPEALVRFQYSAIAGLPGSTPAGAPANVVETAEFWHIAHAQGDLNGDGTSVLMEITSHRPTIWIGPDGSVAQARGWD